MNEGQALHIHASNCSLCLIDTFHTANQYFGSPICCNKACIEVTIVDDNKIVHVNVRQLFKVADNVSTDAVNSEQGVQIALDSNRYSVNNRNKTINQG